MNFSAQLFLFFACFGVTLCRITFNCKKFEKNSLDERHFCVENHLKDFFSKRDHKTLEFRCCESYVDTICSNKIFHKCQGGSPDNNSPLDAGKECTPAKDMKCTKYDENDWGEVDPSKAKTTKPNKKKPDGNKSPGASANSQESQTQSSSTELRSELLLIYALVLTYFM